MATRPRPIHRGPRCALSLGRRSGWPTPTNAAVWPWACGTPPLQAGSPFQIEFQVEPNQFVGVFASLGLASLALPEFEQPSALDLASLINLGIVVADGPGQATGTWALPPGTANLQLWLQGVTTSALALQLGPAVGGVVR